MKKNYLYKKTVNVHGEKIECYKIHHDINGNPRYVFHFLAFVPDLVIDYNNDMTVQKLYEIALERSRSIGGKKYRAKWFGGGIVLSSYHLEESLEYCLKEYMD